jgi:putative PIN family toxin of toxin-antitoxin system
VRVILDTNVFISGIFFAGPPYRILKAWRDGKVQLVISPEILEEYRRVSHDLVKQFPAINLAPILRWLLPKQKYSQIKACPGMSVLIPTMTSFSPAPLPVNASL